MPLANVPEFPLLWPEGRVKRADRVKHPTFRKSFDRCKSDLYDALSPSDGFCVSPARVSVTSNVPVRDNGTEDADVPRAGDPAVAVYFERSGKTYCVTCDVWNKPQHNLNAIVRTLEAIAEQTKHLGKAAVGYLIAGFEVTAPKPSKPQTSPPPFGSLPELIPEDFDPTCRPGEFDAFYNRYDRRDELRHWRARRRWEKQTGRKFYGYFLNDKAIYMPPPEPKPEPQGFSRGDAKEPGAGAKTPFEQDALQRERKRRQREEEERKRREQQHQTPPSYTGPGTFTHWTAVLGADRTMTNEAVERCYSKLARECHPDRGGSEEKMKQLNAAYAEFKRERGIK